MCRVHSTADHQEEAWSFYRTIFGVRLCWELEEPKGPKGGSFGDALSFQAHPTLQGYLAHPTHPTGVPFTPYPPYRGTLHTQPTLQGGKVLRFGVWGSRFLGDGSKISGFRFRFLGFGFPVECARFRIRFTPYPPYRITLHTLRTLQYPERGGEKVSEREGECG